MVGISRSFRAGHSIFKRYVLENVKFEYIGHFQINKSGTENLIVKVIDRVSTVRLRTFQVKPCEGEPLKSSEASRHNCSMANLTRLLTDIIIHHLPGRAMLPAAHARRTMSTSHTYNMFISSSIGRSEEEDDDASSPVVASIIITIMLPRRSILVIISTASSAKLSPQQSRRCSTTGSHLHNKRLRLRRLLADHPSTTFTSNLRK